MARTPLVCSWIPPPEEWKFKADVVKVFYNMWDALCVLRVCLCVFGFSDTLWICPDIFSVSCSYISTRGWISSSYYLCWLWVVLHFLSANFLQLLKTWFYFFKYFKHGPFWKICFLHFVVSVLIFTRPMAKTWEFLWVCVCSQTLGSLFFFF